MTMTYYALNLSIFALLLLLDTSFGFLPHRGTGANLINLWTVLTYISVILFLVICAVRSLQAD